MKKYLHGWLHIVSVIFLYASKDADSNVCMIKKQNKSRTADLHKRVPAWRWTLRVEVHSYSICKNQTQK